MSKNKTILFLVLTLVIVLTVSAVIFTVIYKKEDNTETHKCNVKTNQMVDEWCNRLYYSRSWETIEQSQIDIQLDDNVKQHFNILYNEDEYCYNRGIIQKEMLGNTLDIQKSETWRTALKIQDIREIKNIDSSYCIAIKWDMDEYYYLYCNVEYRPKDLKQYLKDLNIEQFSVDYKVMVEMQDKEKECTIVYMDNVEKMVQNYLFQQGGEYVGESRDNCNLRIELFIKEITKFISIEITSENNIVMLDENSNLYYEFEFDEEKVKALQDYIENEMQGYIVEKTQNNNETEGIRPTILPLE